MLVLSHSVSELYTVCIFWFPYSVRNVRKKFQNCSQSNPPVGELDQPVFRVFYGSSDFSLIEACDLFEFDPFAPDQCRDIFMV